MRADLKRYFCYWCIALFLSLPHLANALTLEEAISLAKQTLPAYKAAMLKVSATEALATASLGPFLPSLDAAATSVQHYPATFYPDYIINGYQVAASWTFFDGGKRTANRNIALLNLNIDTEELRKALINLEYNVKVAFYAALANRDSLEQKRLQLNDAQKDFEVAQGRHKYGLVKLSDTLQASVRLEQAKYNVITAEGEYRKSLADLNSLTGSVLDAKPALEGSLEMSGFLPEIQNLYEAALKKPEIKQATHSVKIAEFNQSLDLSSFWPTISVNAAYVKSRGEAPGSLSIPEEKTVGLFLNWNIFELGKFYRQKSAVISTNVSISTMNETIRIALLDVQKTYENLVTAAGRLDVAREQLNQTEHNYAQAFGEYKIGKADILSLVQAESLLADARTQMISTKLDLIVTKSQLEKVVGVQALELLPPSSRGDVISLKESGMASGAGGRYPNELCGRM